MCRLKHAAYTEMSRLSKYSLVALLTVAASMASAQTSYFPPRSFDNDQRGDEFLSQWYSAALKALNEPSLWERSKSQKEESYRFLWLRSFHHPVAVRVDIKPDGSSEVTVKITSGAGGSAPGDLTKNASTVLTKVQTDRFLSEVKKVGLWQIERRLRDQSGTDGAEWIIEGVRDQAYCVVTRWSPKNGPVRELGVFMLEQLAGLRIPARELY